MEREQVFEEMCVGGFTDEISINGSSVPVSHAIAAQSLKAPPFLVLVEPFHVSHALAVGAKSSVQLVRHDSCHVPKLESPRTKVREHHVLFQCPRRPDYLVKIHVGSLGDA